MKSSSTDKFIRINKGFLFLFLFVATVLAIAVETLTAVFTKPYKSVQNLIEEGNYIEAYEILEKTYNADSLKLKESIFEDYKRQKLEKAEIGDTIRTGYHLTDMEWTVLDKRDGKLFVIAEGVIEGRRYHNEKEPVTWETCSLRTWLNEEFINSDLFSPSDRERIVITNVVNNDNTAYDFCTDGGNDTYDKIFLLSIDEAEKYYSTNQDRIFCKKSESYRDLMHWWLRSPGCDNMTAAVVMDNGQINTAGFGIADVAAVRPVMWIQQEE